MTMKSRFTNFINRVKQLFSAKSKPIPAEAPLTIDESRLGEWKKHVFIAPAFNEQQLVTKLDYYIYTPSITETRPSTSGMPLVVMLHGCTQNATAFAEGTKMNQLAEREGFVVLYPQQSISYNLGKCWRWYDLDESQGMAEAHSIMKIIQSAIMMHDLDPSKIFVAGMSAGAGLASILAASYPEEVRAVALHSGSMLAKANSMKSGINLLKHGFNGSDEELMSCLERFTLKKSHTVPAILFQGMNDDVVHSDNATALIKQFLYLNNLTLDSKASTSKHLTGTDQEYTLIEYKDNNKSTVVEVVKVKNLPHAWSGGDRKHPFNSDKGPQASQIIWDFFKNTF